MGDSPDKSVPQGPDLDMLMARFRGPLVGLFRAWGAHDPIDLAQDVFAEA